MATIAVSAKDMRAIVRRHCLQLPTLLHCINQLDNAFRNEMRPGEIVAFALFEPLDVAAVEF